MKIGNAVTFAIDEYDSAVSCIGLVTTGFFGIGDFWLHSHMQHGKQLPSKNQK